MSMNENKNTIDEPVNIETTPIEEAKDTSSSDTKSTIIKSVALVAGAALLIYSFSSCLGKISDANNSIAESYNKSSSVQASGSAFDGNDFFSGDSSAASTDAAVSDTSTSDNNASADTADDSSAQSDNNTAQDTASSEKKDSGTKMPSTKEEIVNYFNTVINKVKPGAKSITQTKENNYQAGSIDLGSLGAFESAVNKLITSNMGENKEKCGVTATSAADKNKIFPVENETWSSKLTVADVKEAKCTESNGVYTIGIKIVDDELSETTNHGESHNGKAVSIVQTKSIYDNAGAASSLLKGLKIGYKNSSIIIKVDAATGHVLSATYDFTWILHVDVFGGINAPFGITQVFEIKW